VGAVDPNGLSGRRIGLLPFTVNSEYDALMTAAIADMGANGTQVVNVELPTTTGVGEAFAEFDTALNNYLASQPNAPVHSMLELAEFYRANPEVDYAGIGPFTELQSLDTNAYRDSLVQRHVFQANVVALMDEMDLDAIVYPESFHGAPAIGYRDQQPWGCNWAPHGGLAALSVPIGFTGDGLPIGLELMGRPFAEETLIAMAAGYEAHTNHRWLPPTTPPL